MNGRHPTCPAARLLRFVLGALGCVATAPLAVPQNGAAQDGTAGAAEPSAAAIQRLVADLDAAFNRRDVTAYLAPFAPDHPSAHAMLRLQLERLFAGKLPLRRTTTVEGGPRRVGPRTVVRLRHETVAAPPDSEPSAPFVTGELLVLRRDGERAVPTLAVEVPSQYGCDEDRFRCPACNFEIGNSPGWLLAPLAGDRAQAIDAASFYLVGTDVACDVSVRIDPEQPPALALAQRLAALLRENEPTARPGAALAWQPPAYRDDPVPHLGGAQLEVDLPRDDGVRVGRVRLFVVTYGGLQHIALVRGSKRALAEYDAAVKALLASYRLVDRSSEVATATTLPLRAHTGGELAGTTYRNHKFGLEFLGPTGWQAQLRCGGTAFRVAWTSPSGSRLWLVGYTPPVGLRQWCRVSAERWLTQLCANADLELASPGATGGANAGSGTAPGAANDPWQQRAGGSLYRLVTATARHPGEPGTPQRRLLQIDLAPDLLVVADGFAVTEADEAALRDAFASLLRR